MLSYDRVMESKSLLYTHTHAQTHAQRRGHNNARYTSVKTVWSCGAQELCESQGAPNSRYGLCGRKVTMSN